MTYKIKEIFFTQQGEGTNTGKDFVFVRFSGCNLWSGKEKNRASAICKFCDTDFYGTDGINGGVYSAKELIKRVKLLWLSTSKQIRVLCTGGEPLLQLDSDLISAFKEEGFYIAIETNGTLPAPKGIDWICMSPKANTNIKLKSGNEIKVIHPQENYDPNDFMSFDFDDFYIQPMDSKSYSKYLKASLDFCMQNPRWSLSLQTHKILGIK